MADTKTLAVAKSTHRMVQLAALRTGQAGQIGKMAETLILTGLERIAPEVIELAHNGLSDFTPEQFAERLISEEESFASEPLLLRD